MSAPPLRELVALINDRKVGLLRDEANIWSFEYVPEWTAAADAFDLSPHLPRGGGKILDGATVRPVQWFFDNLLPEEKTREILASEAEVATSDAFGLLAYYGKESAGAITLLAPGEAVAESGHVPLSNDELHERIARLPKQSLSAGAPKHMSNAGAQHKLAVCVRDGQLFHPVGNTPSTHILKPDHEDTENWPSTVVNEHFVMQLAARLGLDVPPVEIRYVPDPVYLIERFDRQTVSGETHRLHIIDACQLLGLDRLFKYQQLSVETLVKCISLCENSARSRQSILAWTLFNLLTGNADAHLKNLSFRVHSTGIELAPFYDLVSTESYRAEVGNDPRWPERKLSMRVGAAATFASLTPDDFFVFAGQLGTNRTASARLLQQLTGAIDQAATELYQAFEARKVPENQRAGQLRILRTIQKIVIRDMLTRLAP